MHSRFTLAPQPARLTHMPQGGATERKDLWRGLKDMEKELDPEFLGNGGSENAPMSTTTSLEVAVRYSASAAPTLLRLCTSSSYQRGNRLAFLMLNSLQLLLTIRLLLPLSTFHLLRAAVHQRSSCALA